MRWPKAPRLLSLLFSSAPCRVPVKVSQADSTSWEAGFGRAVNHSPLSRRKGKFASLTRSRERLPSGLPEFSKLVPNWRAGGHAPHQISASASISHTSPPHTANPQAMDLMAFWQVRASSHELLPRLRFTNQSMDASRS